MVEPPFFYGCPLNLKRDTDMVRNVRKHGVADSFFLNNNILYRKGRFSNQVSDA